LSWAALQQRNKQRRSSPALYMGQPHQAASTTLPFYALWTWRPRGKRST
jgi:hypothetical protein